MSSPPESLTTHLLHLHPNHFTEATQTTFLAHAGRGTLGKAVLQEWLAQDRLYAQEYVRFAERFVTAAAAAATAVGLTEKVVDLTTEAGEGVKSDIDFFENVAKKYGLDISTKEGGESEGVRRYIELFEDIGGRVEGGGTLDGLVLLWGMERCYLDAWRFARSQTPPSRTELDADGGALKKELIPHWTSDAFTAFVGKIQDVTEEAWKEMLTKDVNDMREGLIRVEVLWERLLKIEKVFWPVVEA